MNVLLLRHPPVAAAWKGRCYGRSDMGWSRAGWAMARRIVGGMAPVDAIVHSGAIRTRRLAGWIGAAQGVGVTADPRWLERDFGAWEGRSWDAIWRDSGAAMDGMMIAPETYRPGGGETGRDVADRVRAAWDALPDVARVLVVAHGGPIATLRALRARAPLTRAVDFIPACGEVVTLQRCQ
ncbi:histidine phosphatase family protein [Sphingomonas sp. 2R-10]|uniref:histidine phosphatase family protein n=1 Tax=Sphingomonas sp. 2R-10 TaxID=3045148 RepID=UPI000F77787E|nr:histidine phosphatase family protein [Sphingomonas sp. 2R-10]MDJ0277821.1 histidine phosphatase family protein [Sphingomonas sp. 2R-10]